MVDGKRRPESVADDAPATMPVPADRLALGDETASNRGRRVKREALVAANVRRWPTIERDLKDASTNGLSKAKVEVAVGYWWEGIAIRWARERGKVEETGTGLSGLAASIHRMKG